MVLKFKKLSRNIATYIFNSETFSFNSIGYPQYLLYRSLGECLVRESPPKEDCQSVLNVIWKYITNLTDPNKFMHCIEIWIQFTVIHFSVSCTEIILYIKLL